MLSLESTLRPRFEEVVAKVIEGEALIINMASGVYYNTAGAGAFIWQHIEAGYRLQAVAAELAGRYGIPLQRAESDVLTLASRLCEEQLLQVREDEPTPATVDDTAVPLTDYETPAVEIFRDIGHLVALDPPMPGLKDMPWKGPTDESSA